ncbi:MAG: DJ-1/PfpI family protein [Fuerstiella sp.]|nr:DJ-1/PfpI family protein [Fuerstiella sp.]MCP4786963.1 DJ-1/PfpI family protein [Fuerstiella sp.]MCP4859338.1 DJ-1/PfpI family protein [Fuerstiella sp.]
MLAPQDDSALILPIDAATGEVDESLQNQATLSPAGNVAILLFDDVEVLDFCGPFEVFSVAGNLAAPPAPGVFTVAENSSVRARNGLTVIPDHTLDSCPGAEVLIVPGGIGSRREIDNKPLIDWVRTTAQTAELVLSVCTGALLLGKAGLLDGLNATTHHSAFDVLRETVPTATVHEQRRFVDNGRIITSAGIAAGIDMSLHVVARRLGVDVAAATARHMEYPWQPDE